MVLQVEFQPSKNRSKKGIIFSVFILKIFAVCASQLCFLNFSLLLLYNQSLWVKDSITGIPEVLAWFHAERTNACCRLNRIQSSRWGGCSLRRGNGWNECSWEHICMVCGSEQHGAYSKDSGGSFLCNEVSKFEREMKLLKEEQADGSYWLNVDSFLRELGRPASADKTGGGGGGGGGAAKIASRTNRSVTSSSTVLSNDLKKLQDMLGGVAVHGKPKPKIIPTRINLPLIDTTNPDLESSTTDDELVITITPSLISSQPSQKEVNGSEESDSFNQEMQEEDYSDSISGSYNLNEITENQEIMVHNLVEEVARVLTAGSKKVSACLLVRKYCSSLFLTKTII